MGSLDTRRSSDSSFGERHTTLSEPLDYAPPVVVFFSFLDPTSRAWATQQRVVQTIRETVPNGVEVARYHAPLKWSWNFGEDLSHAWAVADSLNIDDQIIGPMFDAVSNKTVHDLEGIRHVFDSIGIPPAKFLEEWGNPGTQRTFEKMNDTVRKLDLRNVPSILVNGRYFVRGEDFGEDFDANEVADTVKLLLEKQ